MWNDEGQPPYPGAQPPRSPRAAPGGYRAPSGPRQPPAGGLGHDPRAWNAPARNQPPGNGGQGGDWWRDGGPQRFGAGRGNGRGPRKTGAGRGAGVIFLVVVLLAVSAGGVLAWPKVSKLLGPHGTQTSTTVVNGPTATVPSGPAPMLTLDKLSPELAAYVNSQGQNIGVAVFDVSHNVEYGGNQDSYFTLASSSKVAIMLSYMEMAEKAGRPLTQLEMDNITPMIEQSANGNGAFNSSDYAPGAQPLYAALGYDAGQAAFYKAHGLPYHSCNFGWGCAESTPAGVVQLLYLLQQGKILNSADRTVVLNLLSNIESDEQYGVGQAAPAGSKVYMKDGWAPNNDLGGFDINTTGWIVTGSKTWIIAVYSQRQPAWDVASATPPEVVTKATQLITKALATK